MTKGPTGDGGAFCCLGAEGLFAKRSQFEVKWLFVNRLAWVCTNEANRVRWFGLIVFLCEWDRPAMDEVLAQLRNVLGTAGGQVTEQ